MDLLATGLIRKSTHRYILASLTGIGNSILARANF